MNRRAICALFGAVFTTLPGAGFSEALRKPKSLRAPLRLLDEGCFFVGGRTIETDFAGVSPAGAIPRGRISVDQMYVHFRIPDGALRKPPIVLVHGSGLTGACYETTPDGREGWATYFVRMGYPVYVVDMPGRGRSGFNSTVVNEAKASNDAKGIPIIGMTTGELAWTAFRFGPKYGTAFSNTQFPVEAIDALQAQGVPTAEATLDGGALQTVPRALAALLDRIGPAVVLAHSQSGPLADALVAMRPQLVRAAINVEGSNAITPTDLQVAAYRGIPSLAIFGDFLDAPAFTAAFMPSRQAIVDRINKQGGQASLVTLPSVGIHGNSHMIMQDRNNRQVADYLLTWLRSHNN